MTYARSLLATTLALSLAACGQPQSSAPAPTPPASTAPAQGEDGEVIAGAYLVGFQQQDGLSAQAVEQQAALQAQAIEAAGGVLTSQWADISAAAVQLSPEALARLQASPLVEYIEPDLVRRALGGPAVGQAADGGVSAPAASTGLGSQALYTASGETTWGDAALDVPTLRSQGQTGQGVAVCIGDTGIDGNHPEFARRLKGFRNFVTTEPNRNDPYQLNDVGQHGTHVAGTVFAQYGAGTGAPGLLGGMVADGVGGVASGANLYMARVLGDSGSGSSSAIINGVNWCVSQLKSQGGTENKVVVNLSLGGGRKSLTEQRAYTSAFNKGVLTVAATGNESTAVSYPAAYDGVLAVAAVDSDLKKADFSNFGSSVDLAGPGVAVLSAVPLGSGSAASVVSGGTSYPDVTGADKSGRGTVTGTLVSAGGTNNEFCGAGTRNPALQGNIALIARGTCSFEEKVANAAGSGATAVIITNNVEGALGLSLTNSYSIPVVGVTQAAGQSLSGQSSATVSVGSADYDSWNGTSMATPHVAAAAAVVWAAKPSLTNAQLETLLKNTARDIDATGKDNNTGYGLVQPLRAIQN